MNKTIPVYPEEMLEQALRRCRSYISQYDQIYGSPKRYGILKILIKSIFNVTACALQYAESSQRIPIKGGKHDKQNLDHVCGTTMNCRITKSPLACWNLNAETQTEITHSNTNFQDAMCQTEDLFFEHKSMHEMMSYIYNLKSQLNSLEQTLKVAAQHTHT